MLATPDTDAAKDASDAGPPQGAAGAGAGSFVIIQAAGLAAAWALVRADVFWREGVVRTQFIGR